MCCRDRNRILDIAKGIGVFFVIAGHMPSVFSESVRLWIFSFHMPLFFLISGYFAKEALTSEEVVGALYGKIRKLLVPYIVYSCIYTILMYVSGDVSSSGLLVCIRDLFLGTINGVQWFFLSLFLTSAIFVIVSFLLRRELLRGVLVLLFVISGFLMGKLGIGNYFRLGTSCFALGFYYLGYLCKQNNESLCYKGSQFKWLTILLIAIIEITSFLLSRHYLDLMINYEMDIIICYIVALSGSAMVVAFSVLVSHVIVVADALAFIGQFSLFFFTLTNYFPYFVGKIFGESNLIKLVGYICGFTTAFLCSMIRIKCEKQKKKELDNSRLT